MEKIFQANWPKKQVSIAVLRLDKIDFKPKLIRRDRKGHCIVIKEKKYYKDSTNLSIYAQNTRELKFMKEMLQLKLHTDSNTLIVGNLNTLLLQIGRSFRQKLKRVGRIK